MKLTERNFGTPDLNSLIHIVNTGETSPQSPNGTSYKTALGDLTGLFGGNYIEINYNDLDVLIINSGLTEGSFYLIEDFQTIYIQPDFNYSGDPKPINLSMTKTGDTEPIVVIATSNHTVSSQAWSIIHPEDSIEYDVRKEIIYQDFCSGNTVETKGKITRRIDDVGNDVPLDFRQVLFKRYGVIPDADEFSDIYQSYKETIKNEFEPTVFQYGNNYGYSIFVNNKFYITNYNGQLYILDSDFNLIETKSVDGFTLSYNETLKRLYIGSYNAFNSYYIDTDTDTLVTVPQGFPRRTDGIVYNPVNNKVYGVVDFGDEIHIFDEDLNFLNTINLSSIVEDSPVGTVWNSDGWFDLTDYNTTRVYDTFLNVLNALGGAVNLVGTELVMHDTINDKYYKIKFTSWTQNGLGGGFEYERELIIDPVTFGPLVSFTKTNYGSEVDEIDTNLSITRANNMIIYNASLQKSSKGGNYLVGNNFGSFYSLTVNECNGDVWVQDYNWAYYVAIDVNDELVFVYNAYKNELGNDVIDSNAEGIVYNPENGKIYGGTYGDDGDGYVVVFDANNRSYETALRMKDVVTTGVSYTYRIRFSESKVIVSMEDTNGDGAIVKINKDDTFSLVTDADLNGTRTIPSNPVGDCLLVNGQYLYSYLTGFPNPNFYSYYVVELNTNYIEQNIFNSKISYNGGEIFDSGNDYKVSIRNNEFKKINDFGDDVVTIDEQVIIEILNSYNIWRFNNVIQSPFSNNSFYFNSINNTLGVRPIFPLPFNLQSKGNIIGADFENNIVYAGFSFNQILGDVKDCQFYLTQSPSKFFRYNSIIAPLSNVNFGGDPTTNTFNSTNIVYKTINQVFTTEILNNIDGLARIRYTNEHNATIIATIN